MRDVFKNTSLFSIHNKDTVFLAYLTSLVLCMLPTKESKNKNKNFLHSLLHKVNKKNNSKVKKSAKNLTET